MSLWFSTILKKSFLLAASPGSSSSRPPHPSECARAGSWPSPRCRSNATLLRPELSPDAHRSRVTVSHPKLFGSGLKFSSVSRGSPCGWSLNHRLAGGLQSRGCPGILRKMLHACVHECFSGDKGRHILQILKHACDPKDNVNSSQSHPTSTADPLA